MNLDWHELKVDETTHYHQRLACLDFEYATYINQLLEQKKLIQSSLKQTYESRMNIIDQIITNNNNNLFDVTFNQNCNENLRIDDESENTNHSIYSIKSENNIDNSINIIVETNPTNEQIDHNTSDENIDKPNELNYKIENKTIYKINNKTKRKYTKKQKIKLNLFNKCNECNKSYATKYGLNKHKNIHRKRFKCYICCKCVESNSKLIAHIESHKNKRERLKIRSFKCNEIGCNKIFLTKPSLIEHNNIHLKKFKCNICEKCVSSNSKLIEHKRIHNGEKPFECNFCGYKASAKRTLVSHLKIHAKG